MFSFSRLFPESFNMFAYFVIANLYEQHTVANFWLLPKENVPKTVRRQTAYKKAAPSKTNLNYFFLSMLKRWFIANLFPGVLQPPELKRLTRICQAIFDNRRRMIDQLVKLTVVSRSYCWCPTYSHLNKKAITLLHAVKHSDVVGPLGHLLEQLDQYWSSKRDFWSTSLHLIFTPTTAKY